MHRNHRRASAATCGLIALLLLACGPSESPADEPAEVTAAEVKEEAREAADAAAGYVTTQRRKLGERAQQAMEGGERQLAEARRKAREIPDRARARLDAAIERGEAAQGALRTEMDQLRTSGAEGWKTTRERVSNALDEVAEARREITAALAGEEETADES